MTVKVRFFAYFRELFGGREKQLELEADTTAGRLLDILGMNRVCCPVPGSAGTPMSKRLPDRERIRKA
jgi:DNA-directed RNA polymerase subunit N (RpoN/RPB10)